MTYAQTGFGRRAKLFSDHTFAVSDGNELTPFAKAQSGLTDAESRTITASVRKNALQKSGPVRQRTPTYPFEVAFEAIQASPRHKSGVALWVPQMLTWRKDNPQAEANTLADLKKYLKYVAKPIATLPPASETATTKAPADTNDTHVHLLGAPDEFPLLDGRTEDIAQNFAAYLAGYRTHLGALGISRGVILQPIFYGTDNSVAVVAVREMGSGFKGVGLMPDDATDAQLDQFFDWNLKAVRLDYDHGGLLTWAGAKAMAGRLADRGFSSRC